MHGALLSSLASVLPFDFCRQRHSDQDATAFINFLDITDLANLALFVQDLMAEMDAKREELEDYFAER